MATAVAAPAGGSGLPAERSVEDVIAGRIRLTLGGERWVLPVRTIAENEAWFESIDRATSLILADVDEDDVPAMMAAVLSLGIDTLLGFLYSYDHTGVLPRDDEGLPDPAFRGRVYPHELLPAVWEVRLAANPTASFALAAALAELQRAGQATAVAMAQPNREQRRSARSSSSRRPTAGKQPKSAAN